jgi:hypothetical protein
MGSIAAFGLALTILFFTLGFGARRFTVTPGLLGLRTTRDLRDQISAATEPEAMYLRLRRFSRNPFHYQPNSEISVPVDHQFEFSGLKDRQIRGLRSLQNSTDVTAN